jgi:hypothetical protein
MMSVKRWKEFCATPEEYAALESLAEELAGALKYLAEYECLNGKDCTNKPHKQARTALKRWEERSK